MSGRPRGACEKCRSQKLACSRQRPTCQRCYRLQRLCVYKHEVSPRQESVGRIPSPIPSGGSGRSLTSPIIEKSSAGIPSSMVPVLIDIYFSHIYNAPLLLHKQTLLKGVAAGTVRSDVLLSVCAFAAKFYRDSNDRLTLIENGLACGWAEQAGQLVWQEAQFPKEENIVSLINLFLFWYSQGEWRRSVMHEGAAVQTARVLGLSVERQGTEDSMESERRRRRFWACYLISSFLTDSSQPKTPSDAALNLSLPCRDEDYDMGVPRDRVSLESSQSIGSVYAELIKAMTLWSAVYLQVKKPKSNAASRLASIQALDGRIHEWWLNFPQELHLSPSNMSSIPSLILPRLLLIHTVYHQCLCTLHSSIVPLFSWSDVDDSCEYARQLSGQTALEHANSLSSLLEAALNYSWDASRMPSFIGYAAYSACAIQIPFMWCSKPEIKQRAQANILSNLKTIRLLGIYWKFIAILGLNVRGLYEVHSKHPFNIYDEPKNMEGFGGTMNGFSPRAARARASILTHNEILVDKEGAVAKRTEEVIDLGLEDVHADSPAVSESSSIANFIAEISREGHIANLEYPIGLDSFPSDFGLDMYDLDLSMMLPLNYAPDNVQIGLFDDWVGPLI